jgi:allantoicase
MAVMYKKYQAAQWWYKLRPNEQVRVTKYHDFMPRIVKKKNWVTHVKSGMVIDNKRACKFFVTWQVKVFLQFEMC